MKQFLAAVKRVSSLFGNVDTEGASVKDWQLVLARAAVGLVIALVGGIVASLVSRDHIIAGVLGTVATLAVRFFICSKSESIGVSQVARLVTPAGVDANYAQMFFFALTFLRPLCIFLLMMRGQWLWLVVAMALSEAVVLELENKHFSLPVWGAAWGVALVFGALENSMSSMNANAFLLSLIVCAIAWMLPSVYQRLNIRLSREAALYVGEALVLVLGVLGMAM